MCFPRVYWRILVGEVKGSKVLAGMYLRQGLFVILYEKARDDEVGDTSGHSRGHEDKVDDEKSEAQNYRYEGIAEQEGYGEKYRGKGDTIGVAHRNVSQKVYEAVGFGLEARSNARVHQRDKRKVEAESKRYR